ncbi:MAG: homoserine kinase [Xanthomonadales bacterium]|nr:homoserine kinase [Xanthomonadales bacterium]
MNPAATSTSARAPATVGNLGVGFDLLGLALEGPHDSVTVMRAPRGTLILDAVRGEGASELPRDPDRNTLMWALRALLQETAAPTGLRAELDKGIPLNAGMGGSAASAVAGLVAANALLDEPLDATQLVRLAAEAEVAACGSAQADNAAPSLLGGLVLAPMQSLRGGEAPVRLSLPVGWRCVLVHPDCSIATRDARRVLDDPFPLTEVTTQQAHLACFVAACLAGDADRVRNHLRDVLVEPRRAPLIPGFQAVRTAALGAGALAFGISGSGPSLFALAEAEAARAVSDAMRTAFARDDLDSRAWISRVDAQGAKLGAKLGATLGAGFTTRD